jgi:hypothetical protein
MRTIQTVMATTSLFCMSLNQLRALILAVETVVTAQANMAILHAAFDSVLITLVAFLGLLRAMHVANAMLFDIPFHEEAAPQKLTRSKNLRIADLNDVQALKMTHFNQSQLHHLCAHFGLAALAAGVGTMIPIGGPHLLPDPPEGGVPLHPHQASSPPDQHHDCGYLFWQGLHPLDIWVPLDAALP